MIKSKTNGFAIVEVLLAVSVFVLLLTSLSGIWIYGQESTVLSGERTRAVFLADEGLEVVRNLRDADFANLTNGTHGLATSSSVWQLSGSSDIRGIFTRSVTIAEVDSNRKQITSTVTWQQNAQRSGSVELVTYLTNWMRAVASIGDWSNPTVTDSINISGNQNGMKIQVQGDYAYLVRNGGNPDFAIYDISSADNPTLAGSLSLSGSPRNIAVIDDYAYVVSNSNSQEFQVIDVSTPSSPSVVDTYNASGNQDGFGVYAISTTAVVFTRVSGNDEFYIMDVSTPSSVSVLGSTDLADDGNEVYVDGDYAYVATDANSGELIVVDISNTASPSVSVELNLPGNANGISITGFDDTVFVGRSNGEIEIVDVTTPSNPSSITSFDADDDANDLSLGNSNTYLFVGSNENSAEFQVVDVSTLSSPTLLGFLNLSGDINGVAYHEDNDRVYAVGDSNSAELRTIAPQ